MILNNHYYQISTLNSKLKSQLLITNTHTHKTKDKKVKENRRKEKEKQFICQHLFHHSSFFIIPFFFFFLLNLFSFHLFDLQFQYYISILYILFIYFSPPQSIMTDQTKIKRKKIIKILSKVDSDVKVSTDTPTK